MAGAISQGSLHSGPHPLVGGIGGVTLTLPPLFPRDPVVSQVTRLPLRQSTLVPIGRTGSPASCLADDSFREASYTQCDNHSLSVRSDLREDSG